MNLFNILAPAATAILLASCGGPGEGKSMEEIPSLSQTDSIFYYFGELRANEYWQDAKRDSTLATRESRDEFMRGIQAGIDMAKSGKDAYNMGVFTGITIAMNFVEYEKQYEQKPNKEITLQGMAYGLRNDSIVNATEVQQAYYDLLTRLNAQKEEADKQKAGEALTAEAAKRKMQKINPNLYAKMVKAGNGAQIKKGDKVNVDFKLLKADGSDFGFPSPPQLEPGSSILPVLVTEALESMKVGETKQFITSAVGIFGATASKMGLDPKELILFTIEAKSIEPSAPEASNDTTKFPQQ